MLRLLKNIYALHLVHFICFLQQSINRGSLKLMSVSKIKNIIFDLGGVIMNLAIHNTIKAFEELGIKNIVDKAGHYYKYPVFYDLEIGEISDIEFIRQLQELSTQNVPHERIKQAWNAMILDMPKDRIDFILNLKNGYRVFLLSNTNSIHKEKFELAFNEQNSFLFTELFEKIYYSHEVGMRKPDEKIFHFVLEDSKLEPQETLFIDDSIQNINTAKRLGIRIFHLQNESLLADLDIIKALKK